MPFQTPLLTQKKKFIINNLLYCIFKSSSLQEFSFLMSSSYSIHVFVMYWSRTSDDWVIFLVRDIKWFRFFFSECKVTCQLLTCGNILNGLSFQRFGFGCNFCVFMFLCEITFLCCQIFPLIWQTWNWEMVFRERAKVQGKRKTLLTEARLKSGSKQIWTSTLFCLYFKW